MVTNGASAVASVACGTTRRPIATIATYRPATISVPIRVARGIVRSGSRTRPAATAADSKPSMA